MSLITKCINASFATKCRMVLLLVTVILSIVILYFSWRFGVDRAVSYDDNQEHFKYGSTGGERTAGFPYWIFKAMPEICPEHLPGKGYESLGLLFEEGKDLPIGMSKRRVTGIDRVFLNCAVCHTGTVRETPDAKPLMVLGMPANNFNVMDFQNFFFNCAKDPRFRADQIIPVVDEMSGGLSLLDEMLVYPVAISLMREELITLGGRFSFADVQPRWGPGRVDTFNAAKAVFNYPFKDADPAELIGTSDLPSIWNQGQREGMQLHWDGNNTDVTERNRSAAFGTGATPPTIDHGNIKRIEKWLLDFSPPGYPWHVNDTLVAEGKALYKEYCAGCHGTSGTEFNGEYVGKVTPIAKIGTDRWRLDSYTYNLAVNQNTLYAGYPGRFKSFRKTYGYANMPLDGLWLRAPYLHNGSVPTLRDLMNKSSERPEVFYRGNDVYDKKNVGFVSAEATQNDISFFEFKTSLPGNGNHGHEGKQYGTELAPQQKDAIVEYLKTF